jgi:hypothetical protein
MYAPFKVASGHFAVAGSFLILTARPWRYVTLNYLTSIATHVTSTSCSNFNSFIANLFAKLQSLYILLNFNITSVVFMHINATMDFEFHRHYN